MDVISHTIFSDSFSWMKKFVFWLKFHWSFVPKGTINNIPALVDIIAKSHYLNQCWLIQRRIYASLGHNELTHWGRVTHICVSKLTTTGSDNGLSPGRRQAIIWTNGGMLLIGPLGTNFSEILSEIHTLSFKKMHLKMSSAKWRPFVSASMCQQTPLTLVTALHSSDQTPDEGWELSGRSGWDPCPAVLHSWHWPGPEVASQTQESYEAENKNNE